MEDFLNDEPFFEVVVGGFVDLVVVLMIVEVVTSVVVLMVGFGTLLVEPKVAGCLAIEVKAAVVSAPEGFVVSVPAVIPRCF